jgi:Type III restriction enzyme, res subunit
VSAARPESRGSRAKLLPHQSALVDTVLDPMGKRVVLLRGGAGLGKSTSLAALARRLLHDAPGARTLFLIPGPLREHFREMLQDADTPCLVADRYWFRATVDSAREDEIWPRGVVTILTPDFANQPDILESLVSARWDLVIADEAHRFKGDRENTLRRLAASAERLVLVSPAAFDQGESGPFPAGDTTVVEWPYGLAPACPIPGSARTQPGAKARGSGLKRWPVVPTWDCSRRPDGHVATN